MIVRVRHLAPGLIHLACIFGCASGPTPPGSGASDAAAVSSANPIAVTWTREPPPPPLSEFGESVPVPRKVHRFRLASGLSVIAEEQRDRPIISLRLSFGHGHTSDPLEQIGATYFAVTLLGDFHEETPDGRPIHGEKSLSRQVWEKGGSFHTFVSADNSGLGLEGYSADLVRYLDILSSAVIDPRRGEETFIARRDDMIHELEELRMSDELGFASVLRQMAFGTEHPYGRFSFGTIKSLKALDLQEVIKHQRRILSPAASTLVIVGDFEPNELEITVARHFGRWRARAAPLSPPARLPPPPKRRRHMILPQPFAETMAICAALPLAERSSPALEVLAQVLGGNFQSRLGRALRSEHGIAYSFFAEVTEQRRADALLSCTRVPRPKAALALRVYGEVLSSLASDPPSEKELLRAKAALRGEIAHRHENVRSSMSAWMDELTVGFRPPIEEQLASLEAVRSPDVQRWAQSLNLAGSVRFILVGDEAVARNAASIAGLAPVERVGGGL